MVIHTDFNQGIQVTFGSACLTIQACVEKGKMRYWVGKPDEVSVTMVQCRSSTKPTTWAEHTRPSAAVTSRPPSST